MNTIFVERYNKLIAHFQSVTPEGNTENHHVVPLCLGGSNAKSNILKLPTRAHFLAHYFLHKAYPENRKLAHAFAMMTVNNKSQDRQFTSRMYAAAKAARSFALKNVPLSEEHKKNMRRPKNSKENYKKPKSAEHAKNISAALKGKAKSPESIAKGVASRQWYYDKRRAESE